MSAFPSLPLFTDAFIADTGHLSAQETGAYLMLMMVAWRSPECRLPDNDDKLARWARVDRRTWLRIKGTVLEFWTLTDGFWMQKRLSKEREIVSKRAEVAKQNGQHGGRPKSRENNDTENPAGSARGAQKKAPNPSPNSSDPSGSAGAEPRAGCDEPELSIKDRVWTEFPHVIAAMGNRSDEAVRRWIGKLLSQHEPIDVYQALAAAVTAGTGDPFGYVARILKPIPNAQARASPSGRPQSPQQRAFEVAKQAHLELMEDDHGHGPFDGDAAEHAAGSGYQNGHARPDLREPLGGRLRLAPPRLAGPPRPH